MVKVGSKEAILIDSWAGRSRIQMLKWILEGGFRAHCEENPAVQALLGGATRKEGLMSEHGSD